jgi:ABC-type phosphate/phosphonate transport system substrate-binding protein
MPQGHLSSGALQKNASTIAAAAKAARASSASTSTKFGALAADMENRTIVTLNKMINGNIVSSSMRPKLETLEDALHDLLKVWVKPVDKAALNAAARKAAKQSLSSQRLSWLPHSQLVDRIYSSISDFINKQWEAHKGLL